MLTLIRKFITPCRKTAYWILGAGFILALAYPFAQKLIPALPYLPASIQQMALLLLGEPLLLLGSVDIFTRYGEKKGKSLAWKLASLVFLFNLIAAYLLGNYYGVRAGYASVRRLLQFLPAIEACLWAGMLLSFGLGMKSWRQNLWQKAASVPDLQKNRKTTWITIGILCGCIALGLFLRLYNLEKLPPYIDEYAHTNGAVTLLQGRTINYDRAFLTVTVPVFLSYRVFGVSLWASRFPMVLINMLAVFPLYYLGKKVHRYVGYLAVFLFATSPSTVAVARNVRDYAVVPVFLFLAAAALLDLLDFERQDLKLFIRSHIPQMVIAASILAYISIDQRSVMKVVIADYVIFAGLLIFLILRKKFTHWKKNLVVAGCALIGALLIVVIAWKINLNSFLPGHQSATYVNIVVKDQYHNAYYLPWVGYILLAAGFLLGAGAFYDLNRKIDESTFFIVAGFSATLLYLSVFLNNGYIPDSVRYGALLENWSILLIALVLFAAFNLLRLLLKKGAWLAGLAILAGVFINYHALVYTMNYQGGDVFKVDAERHYIVEPAYQFLASRVTSDDAFVSDIVQSYNAIAGNGIRSGNLIRWINPNWKEPSDPLIFLDEYPRGWIALSPHAYADRTKLAQENFTYNNCTVHYVGLVGEISIWQWETASP